jgi:hypothetical protein
MSRYDERRLRSASVIAGTSITMFGNVAISPNRNLSPLAWFRITPGSELSCDAGTPQWRAAV